MQQWALLCVTILCSNYRKTEIVTWKSGCFKTQFFGSMQRFLLDSSISYTSPLAYLTVPNPGELSELHIHLKPHTNHLYTPTRSSWQRQTAITAARSVPITCISLWICNLYLPPCKSRDEYCKYAASPHLLLLNQEFTTLFTRAN